VTQEQPHAVPTYLAAHVHDALAQDPACAELGIDVTVTGDRLFLNGTVSSVEQRDRASSIAAALAPELTVCNDLEVLGMIEGHGESERLS
jgi:osmotically-inducible protein OsmY